MRINKKPFECCGCSACYAACPTGAITMTSDEQGFLYPVIDNSKCVDCGKCEQVCSFKKDHAVAQNQIDLDCYALIHKDSEQRMKSRSGGAFYSLACAILARGGVVYGVALNESHQAIVIRVEEKDQLYRLQGSKYVQCDKRDSFRSVKADLESGKMVLYSGTGCEIGGLQSYLQNHRVDTDRLYTCDLICHGVQSPLVWRENLKYIEKKMKKKIDQVSFRDKTFGWHPHIESYRSGKKIRYANRYTTLFYSRVCVRPSCGVCHFCSYERSGDITLADFWGIEKVNIPESLNRGVSLLMIHTKNGKELTEWASDDVCLYPVTKDQTVQKNLLNPSALSPESERFWSDFKKHGYRKASSRLYKPYNRVQLMYNYVFRRK